MFIQIMNNIEAGAFNLKIRLQNAIIVALLPDCPYIFGTLSPYIINAGVIQKGFISPHNRPQLRSLGLRWLQPDNTMNMIRQNRKSIQANARKTLGQTLPDLFSYLFTGFILKKRQALASTRCK